MQLFNGETMFEDGPRKALKRMLENDGVLKKMLEKDGRAVAPKCCAKFSEFRETQHLLAGSHLEKIIEKIVSSS